MYAIHLSSASDLATTFVDLSVAFLLGAMIGVERQLRQRTAGLRTNTLVSVGAAIFVSLGARLFSINGGEQTTITVVAYVVSGIGFLGAGAIMKEGASISGLNTAATLWGPERWVRAPAPGCWTRPDWPQFSYWQATHCCGPWLIGSTGAPSAKKPAKPPTWSL